MQPSSEVIAELAPHGVLRAGINLSNNLLVTSRTADGDPAGVSPDIAAEVAARLGVPLQLVPYPGPGEVADAALADEWDIANIGAEPQRAEHIAFTAAYCQIEATYLVPAGSPITSIDQVDQPGVRIAVYGRGAYGLWLADNLRHATLVPTDSLQSSFDTFVAEGLEAFAGLRPRLLDDVERVPGGRILDGNFTTVQQAIGTHTRNAEAAAWLAAFVEDVKASGLVQTLIDRHQVAGLSVAR